MFIVLVCIYFVPALQVNMIFGSSLNKIRLDFWNNTTLQKTNNFRNLVKNF
ncbi:unnamed protein product [Meloidogyne enterolobii]|uniref:Uncharacterized protein n=1 Tax=Meloidogyne enterolobii TaxID=390850 RepID=A0ACB1ABP7_MELEN